MNKWFAFHLYFQLIMALLQIGSGDKLSSLLFADGAAHEPFPWSAFSG